MVPNNMNESDEHVNLQKTDLWNHQKTALKIRIPEIGRPAFQMQQDRGDRNVPCNSLFQQICMRINLFNSM
jgi:hypothetical protein